MCVSSAYRDNDDNDDDDKNDSDGGGRGDDDDDGDDEDGGVDEDIIIDITYWTPTKHSRLDKTIFAYSHFSWNGLATKPTG